MTSDLAAELDEALAVSELDGAELLDELHSLITDYVVLPTPEAADAITLWIAATHAQQAWQHATRLRVGSPMKRCGKSRLLDVVEHTSHKPVATVDATIAALFRSIDHNDPPTLIVDEADAIWAKRPRKAPRTSGSFSTPGSGAAATRCAASVPANGWSSSPPSPWWPSLGSATCRTPSPTAP
jgi:hypothetical protein